MQKGKVQLTFSPSNPGVPSLPSLPGIPCRRHHIWFTWFWEVMFMKISFKYLHLQAPLWVLLPQDLLWAQFYPVERHIRVSFIHLVCTCETNSHKSKSFSYNFSFGSFESLWSFFSAVTLETSDETHTAIHWWDQLSILAVNYYQTLILFQVCFKQRETHCLSNDAGDARFASETRQALDKEHEVKGNKV